MKLGQLIKASFIAFSKASTHEDHTDLDEEGSFDGGFDINDYINGFDNPFFADFARNITAQTATDRDPRLRASSRIAPIDLVALAQADGMTQTRKFKHVAGLILFLQKVPVLGKYINYGCNCFADAHLNLGTGLGRAIDPVDSACRRYKQCYECIRKDFVEELGQKECHGNGRSYRFKGLVDPVTQQKEIICLNDIGSCKRAICECDKQLAIDLSKHEFDWDIMKHQRWGGYDKGNCKQLASPRMASLVEPEQRCCGDYPNRKTYTSYGKNGERRGCCRGQTFDLDGPLECCQDIGLVPFGTCLGETTVHESFVESVSRGP